MKKGRQMTCIFYVFCGRCMLQEIVQKKRIGGGFNPNLTIYRRVGTIVVFVFIYLQNCTRMIMTI